MINLYPGLGLGGVQSRLLALGLGSWIEVAVIIEVKKEEGGQEYVKWVVRRIQVKIKVYYNDRLIGTEEREFNVFDRFIQILAILRSLKVFVKEVKIKLKEVDQVKAKFVENKIKAKFLEKE